ncbi:MAG TPA: hypothetical protein PKE29_17915 [Phycisphaerales bacterium]|nr:hypothetical protein [Phycisphaerales bacterium]
MAALVCPHCGYDLTGIAEGDGYGTRVCPECGGASRVADVPMPGWMLAPWTFDALLVLIAVPWAMVACAAVWWTGPGGWGMTAALGTLVLAEATAVACVVGKVMGVRRTLGRGFVGKWLVLSHLLAVIVGVPVVWVVTIVRLTWIGSGVLGMR